jgi:predicted nucleic acid-binding protein
MRVYIETTVWSFAFADDSPIMRVQTREFFESCRAGKFEPIIGPPVLAEIARADLPKRNHLVELVREDRPLVHDFDERAMSLASEFVRFGAVPPSKPDDASHVAVAFSAKADALVSWNFKHIANVRRAEKFNAAAVLMGYSHRLIITTPPEIVYDDHSS